MCRRPSDTAPLTSITWARSPTPPWAAPVASVAATKVRPEASWPKRPGSALGDLQGDREQRREPAHRAGQVDVVEQLLASVALEVDDHLVASRPRRHRPG